MLDHDTTPCDAIARSARSTAAMHTHRRLQRLAMVAALTTASAVIAGPAFAQALKPGDMPMTLLPAAPEEGSFPYVPDYSFGSRGWSVDRFAGPNDGNYQGRKVVELGDGDIVVAGIVFGNNLGLVRYDHDAQHRRVWQDVDPAFGEFGNQYIVYPQGGAGQPTGFFDVVDIKRLDDTIFVLANEQPQAGTTHPVVMSFNVDGHFNGWQTFFPGGDANKPAIAMAIDSGVDTLTVLGNDPNNGSYNQLWLERYTIGDGGGLTFDGDFGFPFLSLSSGYCNSSAVIDGHCPLFPSGIVTAGTQLVFPPLAAGYYVSATRQYSSTGDQDPCVAKFSASGALVTSFAGGGVVCPSFDQGGNNRDYSVGIARSSSYPISGGVSDTVYVAVGVTQAVLNGTGVLSLNGDGSVNTAFGGTGKVVFGGCRDACAFGSSANPIAIAKDGNALGIVGAENSAGIGNQPMLAVVDAGTGAELNLNYYPVSVPGTPGNYGEGVLYGVIGSGDESFTVAGDVRDPSTGNTLMYATGRFVSQAAADDSIFHNNFD